MQKEQGQYSAILNQTSLVNKRFIIWWDWHGKSQGRKMGSSCTLGQPIRKQDSLRLACLQTQPYNKQSYNTKMAVLLSFGSPAGNETLRSQSLSSASPAAQLQWNLDITKGQGNGKMCAPYRGFNISRFYFIDFAITGVKKIVKKIEIIIIEAHKFYIKVSLYSLHCYNNYNSVEMSILLSLFSTQIDINYYE